MSWFGEFFLEYRGRDDEKFVKLAKLIIPKYTERFVVNGGNTLSCKRNLSWFTANRDTTEIMRYLNKGEKLIMKIRGKTSPIISKKMADEKGLEYELLDEYYEEETNDDEINVELLEEVVIIGNAENKNQPSISCEFPDKQRNIVYNLGKLDDFYDFDGGEIENFNNYINLVKTVVENDKDMQRIACKFLTEIKNQMGKINQIEVRKFLDSAENIDTFLEYLGLDVRQNEINENEM